MGIFNMNIKDERVAIVSDIHIGKHQNNSNWHKIALEFGEYFRETLKKDNIKDIIICGDVNDDREEISVQSINVVNELFTMWKDFNINIIVGNHDCFYKTRSDVNSLALFSGWENINIINKITEYNIFGKLLAFCPWGTNTEQIPRCDYLFGHFEINGFNLSKMKVCIKGEESEPFLQKAPMIISGHFHLRDDRKYKNGRILYVGSPYELDWGDCGTDPRGFYYLDIPTGAYEFKENTVSPRHKRIRMSEITSAGKITDDIHKEFTGNFVNFIVDHSIKDKYMEKLSGFISSLDKLGAASLKVDYLLEDRVSVEDSNYEYNAVDIKASINEFVKNTDYEEKEAILEKTYELYEKCNKGDT